MEPECKAVALPGSFGRFFFQEMKPPDLLLLILSSSPPLVLTSLLSSSELNRCRTGVFLSFTPKGLSGFPFTTTEGSAAGKDREFERRQSTAWLKLLSFRENLVSKGCFVLFFSPASTTLCERLEGKRKQTCTLLATTLGIFRSAGSNFKTCCTFCGCGTWGRSFGGSWL